MIRRARPALLLALAVLACHEPRARRVAPADFAQVEPLLATCTPCHEGASAEGGVRLGSHYEALGCLPDGQLLIGESAARAPLAEALDRDDHADVLDARERGQLEAWLAAGAPGRGGPVHGAEIMDPRSAGWHGSLARDRDFAPLRDAKDDAACGRCHDGAPARPASVRFPAPGAPACTSCHAQEGGVLACSTCHGQGERAHPPRDACYFPGRLAHDAHATHLNSTRVRQTPLACADCHPQPGDALFSGAHADGKIDVRFSAIAGSDAAVDLDAHTCSVACHARGGRQPEPSFGEALSLRCDGCHQSPPAEHYPGTCDTCHVEMGATPASWRPGPLHLNGRVELGNGDGTCAACHGKAGDPWPDDAMHRRHHETRLTSEISCSTCHVVPEQPRAAGHMNGEVEIVFSGRALRGSVASFAPENKRCDNVACHGGALQQAAPAPVWSASERAPACSSCHRVPPAPPHIQEASCGGGLCHGSEVRGAAPELGITEPGRALHLDGVLQAGSR